MVSGACVHFALCPCNVNFGALRMESADRKPASLGMAKSYDTATPLAVFNASLGCLDGSFWPLPYFLTLPSCDWSLKLYTHFLFSGETGKAISLFGAAMGHLRLCMLDVESVTEVARVSLPEKLEKLRFLLPEDVCQHDLGPRGVKGFLQHALTQLLQLRSRSFGSQGRWAHALSDAEECRVLREGLCCPEALAEAQAEVDNVQEKLMFLDELQ